VRTDGSTTWLSCGRSGCRWVCREGEGQGDDYVKEGSGLDVPS
jgi:hypothetical protein